jgi:hypothetical protein
LKKNYRRFGGLVQLLKILSANLRKNTLKYCWYQIADKIELDGTVVGGCNANWLNFMPLIYGKAILGTDFKTMTFGGLLRGLV